MNDKQIIDLYWQRDQEAIAQTDKAYGGKLEKISQRIVGIREDAQECVSDTYLKTWETLPPQRPTYLFAYLAKLCRNFSLGKLDWRNAAKRKAQVVSLSEELMLCIPDERQQRGQGEISRVINDFLKTLPKESRMIFMRRYFYCDTVAEIAQGLGISESKVKTQLHRLRNKLRLALTEEGISV